MCEKYLDNISLYIDDMLCDKGRQELEDHFNVCENCKQTYEQLLDISNDLNDIRNIEYPENLHEKIMDNFKSSNLNESVNKNKVISLKLYNEKFRMIACVIGLALIFVPFISMMSSDVTKTTVMAYDLNLIDHIKIFGKTNVVHNEVSVSVKSDDITQTFEDLEDISLDIGKLLSSSNMKNVATINVRIDKDSTPAFISYIVDNYDDVEYKSSKSFLAKELKNIENKLSDIGLDSESDEMLSLLKEKEELIEKCSNVDVNITIHE